MCVVLLWSTANAEKMAACPERFHADVIEFVKDVDAAKHKRLFASPDSIDEYLLCEVSVPGHPILEAGGFYIHYSTNDSTYYLSTATQHNLLMFGPFKLAD